MRDKIWNLALTVAVAACGWVLSTAASRLEKLEAIAHSSERDIIELKANRFTATDASAIQKQLADIRESIVRIETKLELRRN